jgi:hypothetical protein
MQITHRKLSRKQFHTRSRKRSPRKRSPRKRSARKRSPRKRSRKNRSASSIKCRKYVSDKIRKTMHEYKKGRYSSRKQAIAVAFSMSRKKYPKCSRYYTKI